LGYFHGWEFSSQLPDWLCFIDAAGRHLIMIQATKEKKEKQRNKERLCRFAYNKSFDKKLELLCIILMYCVD
jgi:hypothetical protein